MGWGLKYLCYDRGLVGRIECGRVGGWIWDRIKYGV